MNFNSLLQNFSIHTEKESCLVLAKAQKQADVNVKILTEFHILGHLKTISTFGAWNLELNASIINDIFTFKNIVLLLMRQFCILSLPFPSKMISIQILEWNVFHQMFYSLANSLQIYPRWKRGISKRVKGTTLLAPSL